jgi:hypothetical protein
VAQVAAVKSFPVDFAALGDEASEEDGGVFGGVSRVTAELDTLQ